MIDLKERFFSTYTKALMEDWTVLATAMAKQTQLIKDAVRQIKPAESTESTESDSKLEITSLLDDRQFTDAFNGPFQDFFRKHFEAYAKISQLELALMVNKGDLFKEKDMELNITAEIPNRLLQLEFSDLKPYRQSLDTLTEQHHTQWEEYVSHCAQLLISTIKQNGLSLSDLEEKDLCMNESISELNNRFIDLKIELPKLSKEPFNFQQYFAFIGEIILCFEKY